MKPEIIFISERDGLVTMSKEDIITLVDKAYNAGKADASPVTTTPWTITPTWTDRTGTVPLKKTDITCSADMRGEQDEEIEHI